MNAPSRAQYGMSDVRAEEDFAEWESAHIDNGTHRVCAFPSECDRPPYKGLPWCSMHHWVVHYGLRHWAHAKEWYEFGGTDPRKRSRNNPTHRDYLLVWQEGRCSLVKSDCANDGVLVKPSIDHFVPQSTDDLDVYQPWNVSAMCRRCNNRKSNKRSRLASADQLWRWDALKRACEGRHAANLRNAYWHLKLPQWGLAHGLSLIHI